MATTLESPAFAYTEDPPAPPSNSFKRKRISEPIVQPVFEEVVTESSYKFSPKRSRPARWSTSDVPRSIVAPTSPDHGVRRKQGKYSLSSLNRRHAPRPRSVGPSRFQEGSMHDKPSEEPPSIFIGPVSPIREASTRFSLVDDLMEEYHDGAARLRQSTEQTLPEERPLAMPHSARYSIAVTPALTPKPKDSGLHRFGRFVASSFNPLSAWGSFAKTWKEAEEDLTVRNIEENRRKAAQKVQAEQKYAELKTLGRTSIGGHGYTIARQASAIIDPADLLAEEDDDESDTRGDQVSGDHAEPDTEEHSGEPRDSVFAKTPVLQQPPQESLNLSHIPFYEETPRTIKSRTSAFFHIKRPSFTNLKKVRSDYTLTGRGRQSATSLSPEKQVAGEAAYIALPEPQIKGLHVHKQQRLSKRVSDLELKLQEARRELTAAIDNASPVPRLHSRFERYTPNNTIKRPKFVPGQLESLPSESLLPSLPSERVLFPSLRRRSSIAKKAVVQAVNASISSLDLGSTLPLEAVDSVEECGGPAEPSSHEQAEHDKSAAVEEPVQEVISDAPVQTMDPSSFLVSEPAVASDEPIQYGNLDARLKALDASYKATNAAKKSSKAKKRKSGANDEDKLFKPANEGDDEVEWQEAEAKRTKKQRRAPTAKKDISPPGKKTGKPAKFTLKKTKKATPTVSGAGDDAVEKAVTANSLTLNKAAATSFPDLVSTNHEADLPLMSVEDQLAPIFEEDDASNDRLSVPITKPMDSRAQARSPLRYGHRAAISTTTVKSTMILRPVSPTPATSQETIHTMTGHVIETCQSSLTRPSPPPPSSELSKSTLGVGDTIAVVTGLETVPEMPDDSPTAAKRVRLGRADADAEGEARGQFEWPEDVF